MDWSDSNCRQLLDVLIRAYGNHRQDILLVAEFAGIASSGFVPDQSVRHLWKELLEIAALSGRLRGLIERILEDGLIESFHRQIRDIAEQPVTRAGNEKGKEHECR